jgi:hypothetical protein
MIIYPLIFHYLFLPFYRITVSVYIYNGILTLMWPIGGAIYLAAASIGSRGRLAGSECIRRMDQRAPTLVYVRH